jgi:hydroxymethylpyrimidine/phosphomethylpyrimidine kinase
MTETKPHTATMSVALSIAGSDSGGGAGIQADLFTFNSLEVFGTTAITCITAQNPAEVAGIEPITPGLVKLQIETVHKAFPITATKTGMLFSMDIVLAVAEAVRSCDITNLVVDPVMISSSGVDLLQSTAIETLCTELLPLARIITPNIPEAELLSEQKIRSPEDMKRAATAISNRFQTACVVKGGHLESQKGKGMLDVLSMDGETRTFISPRVHTSHTHGTGCMFSAAITGLTAKGANLFAAIEQSKAFVGETLSKRNIPTREDKTGDESRETEDGMRTSNVRFPL